MFDREIKSGTVKTAFSQKQLEKAISSLKSQEVHRYFSGTIDQSNKALSELLKLDGLVKSQEFVIFQISHLMISMGYEPGFLKF